ncbi:MAG: MG2 domain-containing protein [Ignavibacteria bacterium]|nr:MG2 domain-containing protein [Ignavibacteria bacterium]
MNKLFLYLVSLFFISNLLIGQSSIYVYTEKNILPEQILRVQVSGFNKISDKIYFEIYRIKDPINLATKNFDFYQFNDSLFKEINNNIELINEFERKIKSFNVWFSETYEAGKIFSRGTYLLRARLENNSSYTFFTCSESGIISKRSIDEILIYVSNRKSSEPISNLELKLISTDKKIYSLKTNKEGIAQSKIGDRPEDRKLFIVTYDNDTTILLQEIIYSPSDEYDRYLVYTYTNQPVYRPKQKVHFKSIIRERKYDELSIPKKLNVRVKILMPDNSVLYDTILTTNSFGSFVGSAEIPDEAPIGQYSIVLEINGMNYPSSFYVEEYKKPEYKVVIKTDKENYSPSEKVEIKISADYFFGKPVMKGKVRLQLYRKPIIRYWWEFEPFANFYRGCFVDIIPYYRPELLLEEEGDLVNGEFVFNYKIDQKIEKNYDFQIIAYVKDETNREVSGSYQFKVTKNKIQVTTNPDRYFYTPNSKIILKVVTTDFAFKPIKKKFTLVIHRVHLINNSEFYEDIDTLKGETQNDGIGFVEYSTSVGGKYAYTCFVEDDEKNVTATGEFIVTDKEIKISGFREGLQVIPAKDVFNEADELEFLIISIHKDAKVFVTLEQSKVYEYRIIKLNGNSGIVKFKSNLPSIAHISAGFYFDNQYFGAFKKFGILKSRQKLNIEIVSDKNHYKPNEKGKFTIRVKDSSGKPVKNAELSSSIIDESIFSIKPEQSKDIFETFTQASIYKILTTTTELYQIFVERENVFPQLTQLKEIKKKGSGIVRGRIFDAVSRLPIENVTVRLIKDDKELLTRTNRNGRFIFRNVPEGNYQLIAEAQLYRKAIISSITIKKETRTREIKLSLLPIEIVYPFYEQDFISRAGAVKSTQFLNGVMPELTLSKIEGNGEKYFEPTIRKEFKDAIYWNGNLITDQNGEVKIEVNYPDNLTSWRNSIKAFTIDNKAGENFSNVIVRKEILIRVETPRYVHEKDEVILPVMVHNYSEKEQKVKIVLNVVNGKIISDKDLRMQQNERAFIPDEYIIKPNDIIKTNRLIKVDEGVDTIVITAKALVLQKLNEENLSDAVEIKIPVEAIGYPEYVVNNFSISKNSEKINSKILLTDEKKNLKVTLKLSPTLLGNILSSIDELVAYPYGCVEQTMSRFLPAIIVANLIREINLDMKPKTLDELPKVIQAGLKRLKELQHNDGGWGWWKDDQTNPFMTAYVVYGLSLTKKAGYQVDEIMFTNGLKALRKSLSENYDNESVSAYLLYSFSEAIEFSENKSDDLKLIRKKFNELKKFDNSPFVVSRLLEVAIKNGFNDEIKNLREKLLKLANVEGNIVFWGSKEFYYGHFVYDPIEITSSAIQSLILAGEKSNLIENAIRWLINQKKGSFWFSTKQTASVIFSLSRYIKMSDELNADFVVKIKLNGNEIKQIKFDKNNLKSGEINFIIPSTELKSGLNEIEVEKSGRGKLYLSLIEKYYRTENRKDENHFVVERKFYLLRFERDGEKLVKKITELKSPAKVGDRILVELKVKAKSDFEYFMLEDPIVPGFERFNETMEEEFSPRWFYPHKEERDKKTAFFMTNFNKGEYVFSYITYAQIPGKYTIPPAIASLMYYPEVRGIGKEEVIQVVE